MWEYVNTYVKNPINKLGSYIIGSGQKQEKIIETIIKHEYHDLEPLGYKQLSLISKTFLRLAAISGLSAITMSAYGSHVFRNQETTKNMRELYFTAQYYHLVHSVALLSLPLCKRPKLTGSLWICGLLLFCGTMYYHALTNNNRLRNYTPYGGILLIGGWLSILI